MKRGFTYYIQDKSNPDLVYYGSSEMPSLKDRLDKHIQQFNAWKKNNENGYCSSFKVLEIDNYEYDVIDIVYFDTKQELREYERPLIEGQICVNERIPNRSNAEWCESNPNYHAEWREVNKEHYLNYQTDYRVKNKDKLNKKITCPCGGRYTHTNEAQHFKTNKHKKWLNLQTPKPSK